MAGRSRAYWVQVSGLGFLVADVGAVRDFSNPHPKASLPQ